MAHLFRAYKVDGAKIPTYFIESTAPDNVDDGLTPPLVLPPLVLIEPDQAIDEIAAELSGTASPNLVVMVHGFNNPQPAVLELYKGASATIENDDKISSRRGLVCVGYRWPSEKMLSPTRSRFGALPTLATWIWRSSLFLLICGLIAIAVYPIWHLLSRSNPTWQTPVTLQSNTWFSYGLPFLGHILAMAGLVGAGLISCAMLLRIIVYFRDTNRATNYGATDLIEIIRQVDRKIIGHDARDHEAIAETRQRRDDRRVQLSFIGHSMGGYVVTNAIRALSDLFADYALRPHLNVGVFSGAHAERIPSKIGHAFDLKRFVLASPDIPAEALLSNRANFLASSLRRFHEAYLFSNEGDEVLRQISTVANYFSFPTTSWKFGFRLGNVELLSSGYGVIPVAPGSILATVRIGYYTLREIYRIFQVARGQGDDFDTLQDKLPESFSYFDCTDYIEPDSTGRIRGLLTYALRTKRNNPDARMSWCQHLKLLAAYCIWQKPDVHGGYFKGALSQRLIYRLAYLGYLDTVTAFGGLSSLSAACNERQIRVLFSPRLPTPLH